MENPSDFPSALQLGPNLRTEQPTAIMLGPITASQRGPIKVSSTQEPKTRNRAINACSSCRERKAKCDQGKPICGLCQENDRKCEYYRQPSDAAGRKVFNVVKRSTRFLERQRKHLVRSVLQSYFPHEHLEALDIEALDLDNGPEDEQRLEPTPLAVADAAYEDDADDGNLKLDMGVMFGKCRITERIGALVRPKMAEELTNALNDARYPSPEGAIANGYSFTPGSMYMAPVSGFLFFACPDTSLNELRLSNDDADQLIVQYLKNVDPVARVVHKPSFRRVYNDFRRQKSLDSPSSVNDFPSSKRAMVFAALFSGAVSMNEEVLIDKRGCHKSTLVFRMQLATEVSLGRAHLSQTSRLQTIQAYVMYLITLCRGHIGRVHSSLVATAIRLAECMGLHKDGTEYGFDPIRTHVGRMLWHQLCFLDIRTSEAHGPRPLIRADGYTTKFPLNVDDDDLEHLDHDTDAYTDVTFSLVLMRCVEVIRSIYVDRGRIGRSEEGKTPLSQLLARVHDLKTKLLDDYGTILDDSEPIQRYTRLNIELHTSRMHAMILHPYHIHTEYRLPTRLNEILNASGIHTMRVVMDIETNKMFKPWLWYAGALQQHHYALLMLLEMYLHPHRKGADAAWKCLDWVFEADPKMPRDQKACLLVSRIRNAMSDFVSAKKPRCPIKMNKQLPSTEAATLSSSPGSTVTAPLENGVSTGSAAEDFSRSGIASRHASSSQHGATVVMAMPPTSGLPCSTPTMPKGLPNILRPEVIPRSEDPRRELPVNWSQFNQMYPQGTFTGVLDGPSDSFPGGLSAASYPGASQYHEVRAPFNEGQTDNPFVIDRPCIPNRNQHGGANATMMYSPTHENIQANTLVNTSSPIYPFNSSFDGDAPHGLGFTAVNNGYAYGHPNGPPYTAGLTYGNEDMSSRYYINIPKSHTQNKIHGHGATTSYADLAYRRREHP